MSDIVRIKRKKAIPIIRRIPIIAQGDVEGWKQDEIADSCGVTKRTIRRDRRTMQFQEYFNSVRSILMNAYLRKLAQLDKIGERTDKRFVIDQQGKLLRAMLPTRELGVIMEQIVVQPVFSSSLASEPLKQVEAEFEEKE